MADISFANLNTAAGRNVFTVTAPNILQVDCGALLGEATLSLSDPKIAEFVTRFLDLASAAQITYNGLPANTVKINSYPEPNSGVPVRDSSDGKFYVDSIYQFASRAPLDKSASTATVV